MFSYHCNVTARTSCLKCQDDDVKDVSWICWEMAGGWTVCSKLFAMTYIFWVTSDCEHSNQIFIYEAVRCLERVWWYTTFTHRIIYIAKAAKSVYGLFCFNLVFLQCLSFCYYHLMAIVWSHQTRVHTLMIHSGEHLWNCSEFAMPWNSLSKKMLKLELHFISFSVLVLFILSVLHLLGVLLLHVSKRSITSLLFLYAMHLVFQVLATSDLLVAEPYDPGCCGTQS